MTFPVNAFNQNMFPQSVTPGVSNNGLIDFTSGLPTNGTNFGAQSPDLFSTSLPFDTSFGFGNNALSQGNIQLPDLLQSFLNLFNFSNSVNGNNTFQPNLFSPQNMFTGLNQSPVYIDPVTGFTFQPNFAQPTVTNQNPLNLLSQFGAFPEETPVENTDPSNITVTELNSTPTLKPLEAEPAATTTTAPPKTTDPKPGTTDQIATRPTGASTNSADQKFKTSLTNAKNRASSLLTKINGSKGQAEAMDKSAVASSFTAGSALSQNASSKKTALDNANTALDKAAKQLEEAPNMGSTTRYNNAKKAQETAQTEYNKAKEQLETFTKTRGNTYITKYNSAKQAVTDAQAMLEKAKTTAQVNAAITKLNSAESLLNQATGK